jgi:branched-chain amino acid transport system permease protein
VAGNLQIAFDSLGVASVYALLGVSITLIFGLTGIVNFAQGQFMMLAAYIVWALASTGINFFAALALGVIAMVALGIIADQGLFRFTLRRPISGFIVSLGLIPIITVAVEEFWTDNPLTLVPPFTTVWHVGGVSIVSERLLEIGMSAAILLALAVVLRWTHLGRALRAAAEDREMTGMLGVNTGRLITVTWAIGSAVVAVAGGLWVTLYPIQPEFGQTYIFYGFAAALIGGLGSVGGAVIAAIVTAEAEGFLGRYVASTWTDAYVLGLMMLILMIRPTGIFKGATGSALT